MSSFTSGCFRVASARETLCDGEPPDSHDELGEIHFVQGVQRLIEIGERVGGGAEPPQHQGGRNGRTLRAAIGYAAQKLLNGCSHLAALVGRERDDGSVEVNSVVADVASDEAVVRRTYVRDAHDPEEPGTEFVETGEGSFHVAAMAAELLSTEVAPVGRDLAV